MGNGKRVFTLFLQSPKTRTPSPFETPGSRGGVGVQIPKRPPWMIRPQMLYGWCNMGRTHKCGDQLSTLRRIIRRKSSGKNFKSSANPASPFPNKHTVENDPYPFPNVRYSHLQIITFMMTVQNGALEGAASLSFKKCVQWDLNQCITIPQAWHEPLDQRTSAFYSELRTVYCLEPCLEKAHIQRKSSVTFLKSSANPASTTEKSTAK